MNRTLEHTLIEAFEAVERGEAIDVILARYPDLAAELRPVLAVASQLAAEDLDPSPTAQTASRAAFLDGAARLRAEAAAPNAPADRAGGGRVRARGHAHPADRARPSRLDGWLTRWARPGPVFAGIAAAVIAFLVVTQGAAAALPGDRLYTVKQALERAQVALSPDPDARAALEARFNQRRIDEVAALLAGDRAADVAFTGTAEQAADGAWRVAGVPVALVGSTQILGDFYAGEQVHVIGHAQGGRVVAATIVCLDDVGSWVPGEGPPPRPGHTPKAPAPTPTTAPTLTGPGDQPAIAVSTAPGAPAVVPVAPAGDTTGTSGASEGRDDDPDGENRGRREGRGDDDGDDDDGDDEDEGDEDGDDEDDDEDGDDEDDDEDDDDEDDEDEG